MKTMKQMQKEQLDKCYTRDGWPRPFVHFGGAIELAESPDHMGRLLREEVLILVFAVVVVSVATVAFILVW